MDKKKKQDYFIVLFLSIFNKSNLKYKHAVIDNSYKIMYLQKVLNYIMPAASLALLRLPSILPLLMPRRVSSDVFIKELLLGLKLRLLTLQLMLFN